MMCKRNDRVKLKQDSRTFRVKSFIGNNSGQIVFECEELGGPTYTLHHTEVERKAYDKV